MGLGDDHLEYGLGLLNYMSMMMGNGWTRYAGYVDDHWEYIEWDTARMAFMKQKYIDVFLTGLVSGILAWLPSFGGTLQFLVRLSSWYR